MINCFCASFAAQLVCVHLTCFLLLPPSFHPPPAKKNVMYLLCPKHQSVEKHAQSNICLACGNGGTLSCCDTCPAAYHRECLKDVLSITGTPTEDHAWHCHECLGGSKAIDQDIIWYKVSRGPCMDGLCKISFTSAGIASFFLTGHYHGCLFWLLRWLQMGSHRFWPARILEHDQIPDALHPKRPKGPRKRNDNA